MVVPLSCAGNWAREAANGMVDDKWVGVRWQFGVDVGYLVGLELKEVRFLPVVGVRGLGR